METNKYLLTIFLLSIIIVVSYNINNNNIHKIEYDIDNIKTIKYITNYNYIFNKYKKTTNISKIDFNVKIPNIEKIIVLYLNPNNIFNVNDFYKFNYDKKCIMVIYNIDNNKFQLLISKNKSDGIFYDIKKQLSVTNIYPIYNNNNYNIRLVIILILNPHWFL